jgi:hypothetical protein
VECRNCLRSDTSEHWSVRQLDSWTIARDNFLCDCRMLSKFNYWMEHNCPSAPRMKHWTHWNIFCILDCQHVQGWHQGVMIGGYNPGIMVSMGARPIWGSEWRPPCMQWGPDAKVLVTGSGGQGEAPLKLTALYKTNCVFSCSMLTFQAFRLLVERLGMMRNATAHLVRNKMNYRSKLWNCSMQWGVPGDV